MESVLRLKLPWTLLRHNLAAVDDNGNILYMSCLDGYKFDSAVPQVRLFLFYPDKKFGQKKVPTWFPLRTVGI